MKPLNLLNDIEFLNIGNMHDTDVSNKRIYFGFAGKYGLNFFTHKSSDNDNSSTTSNVVDRKNEIRSLAQEEIGITLHTVQNCITFDVATAFYIFTKFIKNDSIENIVEALVEYTDLIEIGKTPKDFKYSIYAYFQSIIELNRNLKNDHHPDNIKIINEYFKFLDLLIKADLNWASDDLDQIMTHPSLRLNFKKNISIIEKEISRYIENDYERSTTLELELPLKDDLTQEKYRVGSIILETPKSKFFKYFTRSNTYYQDQSREMKFPLSYVHNSQHKGLVHEHIISIPPDADYNLKGLSNILEDVEDWARSKRKENPRGTDAPRPGYKYNDPWYDARHQGYTIIDTPNDGSRLSKSDVEEILWFYGNPGSNIYSVRKTNTIFLTAWDESKDLYVKLIENEWDLIDQSQENIHSRLYPNAREVIGDGVNEKNNVFKLRYKKEFKILVSPEFEYEESYSVQYIRNKMKVKTQEIVDFSQCQLEAYIFDFGLVLFAIRVDYSDQLVSIFEGQWLGFLLSKTPVTRLCEDLGKVTEIYDSKMKHPMISNHSGVSCLNSSLNIPIPIKKLIILMVNNTEPLFKNLPVNTEDLIKEHHVLDKEDKRLYFTSNQSLVSLIYETSDLEHKNIHLLFEKVYVLALMQKLILEKSRNMVADVTKIYLIDKKKYSLFDYILGGKSDKKISLNGTLEIVQHLTSTYWFSVVSPRPSVQKVFELLRNEMHLFQIYDDLRDRIKDLEEYTLKKAASAQGFVFTIFTFVLSPINLSLAINKDALWENVNSFPYPFYMLENLSSFSRQIVFSSIFSIIFLGIWVYYKWKKSID